MLTQTKKTRHYSATSEVVIGSEKNTVAVMDGNVTDDKELSFSYSILNKTLYEQHKDEVETDFEEFKNTILSE